MRFTRLSWIRALALPAALLAAFAVAPAPTVSAGDEIDAKIAGMKGFEKAGDEGKCLTAMQELKESAGDPRVMKAWKELVSSKHDKVACGAVNAIASSKWRDVEFLKWMVGKLDDKDFYKEKDGRPEVFKALLDALQNYRADKPAVATFKSALPKLADLVKKFLSTNADYTTRAIHAYGCVRDKFTMEQVLEWGEQIEARQKGGGAGGGGNKKGASQETRDIEDKAKRAVLETLAEMTGKEALPDLSAWRKWWTENAKTFQFPAPLDPNGPGAAAAPTTGPPVPTGAEFKDDFYGYVVHRPEAEGWAFKKPDFDAPRMMMEYATPEDPGYVLARVYFAVHNPAVREPKDVKQMAEWVLAYPVKEEVDVGDNPPTPKETKLAGDVEWTTIEMKGEAIGRKASFGRIERHFYIVKLDSYILWIDAFVRTGAEDDVKKALWSCVESVALPAPKK